MQNPKTTLPVFKAIAEYISQLHSQISDLQASLAAAQSAASVGKEGSTSPGPIKKRKLDSDDADTTTSSESTTLQGTPLATLPDLSFSVPQRKKFTLVLTSSGIAATLPTTGKVEWSVEWSNIKTICLLPVPEKAVRQLNFVIFPHGAEGVDAATSKRDPAVFTIPENAAPKATTGPALGDSKYDASSYQSLLTSIFNAHAPPAAKVISPIKSEFQSALPQPHRKGEPAFHVKAHRGTKEGYLWFLGSGVVWGFKKPLMFIEFVQIDSVSYTSITKRTFNLNIHIHPGKDAGGGEDTGGGEVEFAMVDQADYTGIDEYVRKHRLNDVSMAEMRRAVLYNVNKPRGEDGNVEGTAEGGAGEEPTVSDLQRALEQAEDEEEGGDYNPDEGGEGEDSEEDSEDEDDSEESGDESDEDEDEEEVGDLRDELGSELEEVEGGGDSDEEMGGVAKAVVARRSKRGR